MKGRTEKRGGREKKIFFLFTSVSLPLTYLPSIHLRVLSNDRRSLLRVCTRNSQVVDFQSQTGDVFRQTPLELISDSVLHRRNPNNRLTAKISTVGNEV